MGALPCHAFDFLGRILYLDAHVLKILQALGEILFGPGKFHDHNAFSPGQNSGIENIEGEIVVFYQIADNGLFSYGFGKS